MSAAPSSPLSRRLSLSFLYVGVGHVVGKLVYGVALFLALRITSPADWGLAHFVLQLMAILQSVAELSLGVALVQAPRFRREQVDALFWLSAILTSAFYATLFFVIAPLAAIRDPQVEPLLRVVGLSVFFFSLTFVSRAFMERDLQFGRLSVIENLAATVGAGTLLVLAYRGLGPWAFVWGEVASRGSQALFTYVVRPYRPRLTLRLRRAWPLVTFGLYASGSRLLYNFYSRADYLIVYFLLGKRANGLYSFAYHVVTDPSRQLVTVLNKVAYPAFARLQGDRERLRRYFFAIARVSLLVVGMILMVEVGFLDQILRAVDLDQYLPALPIVLLLVPVVLVKAVAPLVPQLLNAVGRPRENFLYSAVCAAVFPVAFAIGASFGLLGVGVAWLVAYPVVVLVLFRFGARALGLSMARVWRPLIPALAAVLPVTAVVLSLRWLLLGRLGWGPVGSSVAGVGTTAVVAAALAWWLEREQLRQAFVRPSGGAKGIPGDDPSGAP